VETILYNHALNVKRKVGITGHGVKTMVIVKGTQPVNHVVLNFEDIF
jgi:hypothetical protein